jgi:hypothetical protein
VPWRIFLAVPDVPAPATGFPLIVLLDANAGFATLTETLRRARRAMVDRTRAFATATQARLPAGSEVECTVLPDGDHASVLAVAMGRALRFVLRA